MILFLFTL